MVQASQSYLLDDEIKDACAHFLEQVKLLLPLDALTVVLLNHEESTGRVAFSWKSASRSEVSPSTTLEFPIRGNYGALGSVLVRAPIPTGFTAPQNRLVIDLLNMLAVRLENIQLRQRVQSKDQEMNLVDEIAGIVTSIENNLEDLFIRLSDCLGKAIGFDQALLSWIASGQPDYRIDTLQTINNSASAEQFNGGTDLLSRLTVPLSHYGAVIGSLELRRKSWPFSAKERDLLHQVGNQIAPAVYNVGLHQLTMLQAFQLQQKTKGGASSQESRTDGTTQDAEPMVDLAHALYSPLTSIKGYTCSLLQPGSDWPEEVRQEFLRTINQAADRLNRAIRDLVLPTQQNLSCQVDSQPETRVQEIFRLLELELSGAVTASGVKFICDPKLPKMSIDSQIAESVIRHLVDCATAYTVSPAKLRVRATSDHQSVTISVEFTKQPDQPSIESNLGDTDLRESDLRVVVCRKMLNSAGITLNVERLGADAERLWFQTPVAQKSDGGAPRPVKERQA